MSLVDLHREVFQEDLVNPHTSCGDAMGTLRLLLEHLNRSL
jgi:hypothetical protein